MCSMIKVLKNEFLNSEGAAICECRILFLGIPVYYNRVTTFNQNIVKTFLTLPKISIKGFNNETKDLCKKNQQGH